MRLFKPMIVLAFIAVAALTWQHHAGSLPLAVAPSAVTQDRPSASNPARDDLPPEAQVMLRRIARGGPFDHRQDGAVFGNYEGFLPRQQRGYYHEYTVKTAGAGSRGARRIVTGGTPPAVWYYTGDHYRSFRRIQANP